MFVVFGQTKFTLVDIHPLSFLFQWLFKRIQRS